MFGERLNLRNVAMIACLAISVMSCEKKNNDDNNGNGNGGENKTGFYIGDTHYQYFDDAFFEAQGTTAVIIAYGNALTSSRTLSENTHITIESGDSKERIFEIGSGANFFTIKNGTSLTLKNITLDAKGKEKSSLVRIEGGTFTMLEGSKITGGVYKDGYGGGVQMNSGYFIMKGGVITANQTPNVSGLLRQGQGGGVYMNGGTFTMEGGEITGNTATGGGGLYVTSNNTQTTNSSFIMKGGRIYANKNSTGANSNLVTAYGGTAVYGDGSPITGGSDEDLTGRN
jgi:hypothetical protein